MFVILILFLANFPRWRARKSLVVQFSYLFLYFITVQSFLPPFKDQSVINIRAFVSCSIDNKYNLNKISNINIIDFYLVVIDNYPRSLHCHKLHKMVAHSDCSVFIQLIGVCCSDNVSSLTGKPQVSNNVSHSNKMKTIFLQLPWQS